MPREIAYLPQRSDVDWSFPITVRALVEMGRYPALGLWKKFSGHDREIVEKSLHVLGLEHLAERQISELSGGQQQRVAVARSLINNPGILLADEPTGNLDSTTSKEVLHMFKDLNRQKGITVILVTHDPKIAAFTDRAINMEDGLICEGISDKLSKEDV